MCHSIESALKSACNRIECILEEENTSLTKRFPVYVSPSCSGFDQHDIDLFVLKKSEIDTKYTMGAYLMSTSDLVIVLHRFFLNQLVAQGIVFRCAFQFLQSD